jgi:hypothetical protein
LSRIYGVIDEAHLRAKEWNSFAEALAGQFKRRA